jgi:hypothetical protein
MSQPPEYDFDEIRIEVRFEDEDEGYYDFVLPEQRVGYSKTDEKETFIYVPKEMAKDVIFASSDKNEKLLPKSSKNAISQFAIPSISFFCDRDDDRMWILRDFLTPFSLELRRQALLWFPDQTSVVSSAPINLELSPLNLQEDIQKMCRNIVLCWWIRRWGRCEGTDKRQPFVLPAKFEFLPEEVEKARQTFDTCASPFEGYLDIEIYYEMEGGYYLQGRKETIRVMSFENFLAGIKDRIWIFMGQKEKLIPNLVQLFHSVFNSAMPLDVFQSVVKGDEDARVRLIWDYGYSPLVSRGFPEFDLKHEDYRQLVEETSKMLLRSLFMTFSTEKKLPKIPEDVLTRNLEEKIRQLVDSILISRGVNNALGLAPAKLFAAIDAKWKSYL